ncbi:MAG: hypothetical protein HQL52_07585 [Magnetococcales bacterium]|nr:hypothetical protein [Magnetococcales bacterium]
MKQTNPPYDRFSLEEANQLVAQDYDIHFWQFIIQQINDAEIRFDEAKEQIVCPGFIPFKELALEVIADLDPEVISCCRVCAYYFDINQEEGIFCDPANLEGLICKSCSEKITARDYYEKFMVT